MKGTASELVAACRRLYQCGLATATGGNVSVRIPEGVFITPGGSSLGSLEEGSLSVVDPTGKPLSGPRASKETSMHLAIYAHRPTCTAVVHTHSPHCVACSCLLPVDSHSSIPPLTAYFAARIGDVPNLPFMTPGSSGLAEAAGKAAANHPVMLLQNHGATACGQSLEEAINLLEETEAAAQVYLLTVGRGRRITAEEIERMKQEFAKIPKP